VRISKPEVGLPSGEQFNGQLCVVRNKMSFNLALRLNKIRMKNPPILIYVGQIGGDEEFRKKVYLLDRRFNNPAGAAPGEEVNRRRVLNGPWQETTCDPMCLAFNLLQVALIDLY
jgi:hypothetical protein